MSTGKHSAGRTLLATGLLLAAGLLLTACGDDTATRKQSATSSPAAYVPTGNELRGNDARAWLSRSGGSSDMNYCNARLRLPLDEQPAWEWKYSSGSFSPSAIASLTHHDGKVYAIAYYQSLACLDAGNGSVIFNDYLQTQQGPEAQHNNPFGRQRGGSIPFSGMFLHPAGEMMLLTSFRGDRLLYDISGVNPSCIWQGEDQAQQLGFLLSRENICIGAKGGMETRSLDGTLLWEQATHSPPIGNVLSDSGVLVTYNDGRNIWANRVTDGALLWSMVDSNEITSLVIDDQQDCVYVSYYDERLVALDISDGGLLWEHDFSDLLADEQRAALLEAANRKLGLNENNRIRKLALENVALVVAPDGLVLAVDHGFVVSLDHAGKRRWQRTELPPIASAMGFSNGLLLQHYWYPPELGAQNLVSWQSAIPVAEPPAWRNISAEIDRLDAKVAEIREMRALPQDEQEARMAVIRQTMAQDEPLQILHAALAVLDPQDGSDLGGLELPHLVNSGFCPAVDKIVMESSGFNVSYYMARKPQGGDRRVIAYNWLEPGGDS